MVNLREEEEEEGMHDTKEEEEEEEPAINSPLLNKWGWLRTYSYDDQICSQ